MVGGEACAPQNVCSPSLHARPSHPQVYVVDVPASPVELVVRPSTQAIRPFVVAAVLRGVTFTPASYASFIDLQDK